MYFIFDENVECGKAFRSVSDLVTWSISKRFKAFRLTNLFRLVSFLDRPWENGIEFRGALTMMVASAPSSFSGILACN